MSSLTTIYITTDGIFELEDSHVHELYIAPSRWKMWKCSVTTSRNKHVVSTSLGDALRLKDGNGVKVEVTLPVVLKVYAKATFT